jgi:hypothetical protein
VILTTINKGALEKRAMFPKENGLSGGNARIEYILRVLMKSFRQYDSG